jgi:hypothetical protein
MGGKMSERELVQDKAKAEEMAYAEKPHRDDALVLNGLVERSYELKGQLSEERLKLADKGGHDQLIKDAIRIQNQDEYTRAVSRARDHSLNFARHAAEKAAEKYDAQA